jgi:hypothetical protein
MLLSSYPIMFSMSYDKICRRGRSCKPPTAIGNPWRDELSTAFLKPLTFFAALTSSSKTTKTTNLALSTWERLESFSARSTAKLLRLPLLANALVKKATPVMKVAKVHKQPSNYRPHNLPLEN